MIFLIYISNKYSANNFFNNDLGTRGSFSFYASYLMINLKKKYSHINITPMDKFQKESHDNNNNIVSSILKIVTKKSLLDRDPIDF